MTPMEAFLPVLLLFVMGATLLILIVGVVGFAANGEFNRKYGNKLMRMRVLFQGIAILIFALVIWMAGK